jgi:hypothetical protein
MRSHAAIHDALGGTQFGPSPLSPAPGAPLAPRHDSEGVTRRQGRTPRGAGRTGAHRDGTAAERRPAYGTFEARETGKGHLAGETEDHPAMDAFRMKA